MSYYRGFLKSIFSGSYHLWFFPAYSFKTILEALKIIALPTPSYNLHEQLFVEKLTDYLQVISRELQYMQPLILEDNQNSVWKRCAL